MSADPARKRSWPVQGHVAIVSAEAQTHVLLPVQIVEALPESEREVLRTVG